MVLKLKTLEDKLDAIEALELELPTVTGKLNQVRRHSSIVLAYEPSNVDVIHARSQYEVKHEEMLDSYHSRIEEFEEMVKTFGEEGVLEAILSVNFRPEAVDKGYCQIGFMFPQVDWEGANPRTMALLLRVRHMLSEPEASEVLRNWGMRQRYAGFVKSFYLHSGEFFGLGNMRVLQNEREFIVLSSHGNPVMPSRAEYEHYYTELRKTLTEMWIRVAKTNFVYPQP
ncbi:hypothetical protein DRJ48_01430 [Candidatus Woesearchaeota archaeon]|nr:hypothetical protein [Candidatus Woesearchaeota archaeon]RLE43270.1 MAG: hypothetical protein DRJ48_01430 [Candidatus Woesearchaeota archaeon]